MIPLIFFIEYDSFNFSILWCQDIFALMLCLLLQVQQWSWTSSFYLTTSTFNVNVINDIKPQFHVHCKIFCWYVACSDCIIMHCWRFCNIGDKGGYKTHSSTSRGMLENLKTPFLYFLYFFTLKILSTLFYFYLSRDL